MRRPSCDRLGPWRVRWYRAGPFGLFEVAIVLAIGVLPRAGAAAAHPPAPAKGGARLPMVLSPAWAVPVFILLEALPRRQPSCALSGRGAFHRVTRIASE